jgi:hypothetical protein
MGQPAPIEILLIGIGTRERQIDVVEHARILGAGLSGRAGHEPLGECRYGGSIVVIEERAIRRAMRMRLGRGSGAVGRRMRWMRLRDGVGHQAGSGSRPDCRAD